jgi:hypothetical protein
VAAQTGGPRSALLPLRDRQVNSANPQTLLPAPLFRPRRSPPPTPYAPRPGTGDRRSASDAFAQAAMMPVRMSVSAARHAIRRAFVTAAAATTSVRSAGIEDRQFTTQSRRSVHISRYWHHRIHPSKTAVFERNRPDRKSSVESRLNLSQNTFLISASQKARVRLSFKRGYGD